MRRTAFSPAQWSVARSVAAIALAAAAVAVYRLDPGATAVVLCPYRALSGLACPGCGLTRAVHFLLHADPWTALAYNPLAFVAAPAMCAFVGAPSLLGHVRGQQGRTAIGWAMLALTLAFWFWRNTAAYPWLRL